MNWTINETLTFLPHSGNSLSLPKHSIPPCGLSIGEFPKSLKTFHSHSWENPALDRMFCANGKMGYEKMLNIKIIL